MQKSQNRKQLQQREQSLDRQKSNIFLNSKPASYLNSTSSNAHETSNLIKTSSKFIYNKPQTHYELIQQRLHMQHEFAQLLTNLAQQHQPPYSVGSGSQSSSVAFNKTSLEASTSAAAAVAAPTTNTSKNSLTSFLPFSNWFF